ASGTAPLTYSWRKGGNAIAGATNTSYSIAAVVVGDSGTYDCVVSNVAGSVTSSGAVLTVTNVFPTVSPITPAAATVCSGGPVTFSATSSSPGPLTYQWSKDSAPIPGATTASLTIPAASSADAGQYRLSVTNQCGAGQTTAAATLTVNESVAIGNQPVD